MDEQLETHELVQQCDEIKRNLQLIYNIIEEIPENHYFDALVHQCRKIRKKQNKLLEEVEKELQVIKMVEMYFSRKNYVD